VALDSSVRSATLSSFTGVNPNGNWTLFLVDMQSGGTSELDRWGMEIVAVPEPGRYALIVGAGLIGFAAWRRRENRDVPRHTLTRLG